MLASVTWLVKEKPSAVWATRDVQQEHTSTLKFAAERTLSKKIFLLIEKAPFGISVWGLSIYAETSHKSESLHDGFSLF
jgi:hypothetical protein